MTPLHFAVEVGAEDVVNFLVDKGKIFADCLMIDSNDTVMYATILSWS